MDASPFFSGKPLSVGITGDGVAIDPASGLVTLNPAALVAGVDVRLRAATAEGPAEAGFQVRMLPSAAAPTLRRAPVLTGAGLVGAEMVVEPGLWDGAPAPALTFQWLDEGAPIAGATGARFVPAGAQDRALLVCRVTATNASGAASAETAPLRIVRPAPQATGTLADLVYARGAGVALAPTAAAFSGFGLRFAVAGAGALIDPITGVLSISTEADLARAAITVTATNSGGAAQASFAVTVQAAPETIGAPAAGVFALGAASATLQTRTAFAGTALSYALEGAPAGVAIDAATGAVTVPTTALLSATFQVRAANAVGSAVQTFEAKVVSAPTALGTAHLLAFAQGTAFTSVSARDYFEGSALTFALVSAPAGVAINSNSGALTIPTSAALSGTIVVQATNVAGSAVQNVAVTVLEAPLALDAPAPVAFARIAGAAMLETAAFFSGGGLAYALVEGPAGAAINAATGVVMIPTAAALSATVTVRASNPLGSAAQSVAVTVMEAPSAVGAPAATVAAQGPTPATVAMAPFFAGPGLVYALGSAPAGVTINAATGLVTIQAGALLSGTVAVRATNAVGAAVQSFAVMVMAAPTAVGDPRYSVFAQGAAGATVATRGFFAGTDLIYALGSGPEGTTVNATTGVAAIPTGLPLAGTIVVRAMNPLGSVPQKFLIRVVAAPIALAAPAPAVFATGAGAATISTQAFFDGAELTYALVSGPAGTTINPGSGLVTIPTAAALSGTVVVRASNVAGAVQQSVGVTVSAAAAAASRTTVFDAAAALAETTFLFSTTAPSWTLVEAGVEAAYARLVAASSDRAHGAWSRAQGDGRYRILVRAPLITSTGGELRPFGFAGRLTQSGANFRGLRAEAAYGPDGIFALHLREYTGTGIDTATLASADVGWTWGAWHWLDMEFDGAAVQARLYAEDAAAPNWQVRGTTAIPNGGAFGPSAFALGTRRPNTELRRLEFHAKALAPAAPLDGDWTLDQITVQK